ncbi:MAG: hypothetical protein LBT79_02705 [Elusimicrobiota bacterium]|nr:hypothetical protein [Elusimicrobiota bacterium]
MKELVALLKEFVKSGKSIQTLSKDWNIDILSNHKVKEIVYGIAQRRPSESAKERNKIYIASLEDLIKNSSYESSETPRGKRGVESYHYFKVFVKIGNKIFPIKLSAEELVGESTLKPQTVHLHFVDEYYNKNIPSGESGFGQTPHTRLFNPKGDDLGDFKIKDIPSAISKNNIQNEKGKSNVKLLKHKLLNQPRIAGKPTIWGYRA